MATEEQVHVVLAQLQDVQACRRCGTALRFGDFDCPHCGLDLEDHLREWAESLVDEIETTRGTE